MTKLIVDSNDLSQGMNGDGSFRIMNQQLQDYILKCKLRHFSIADCKLEPQSVRFIAEAL